MDGAGIAQRGRQGQDPQRQCKAAVADVNRALLLAG
jgi:hypothetical protein